VLGIDVTVRVPGGTELGELAANASRVQRAGDEISLTLPADTDIDAWLARSREIDAKLVSVSPRHETLEEMFLREIANADKSATAKEGRP
jgi:L-cysteine desulfidase